MRKVINVNLNGNAYQLDEDACDLLAAYLARAEAQLKDNPDRAEIVAELEQAIAEKCGRFLGPRKTVVAAGELRQIVDELAFFVLLAFAIYSLVTTGAILGWRPPAEIPLWAGILILVALCVTLVSPLSAARHAWYYGYRGRLHPPFGVWNEIVPLAGAVFLVWLGYLYVPAVHSLVAQLLAALHHLLQRLRATS